MAVFSQVLLPDLHGSSKLQYVYKLLIYYVCMRYISRRPIDWSAMRLFSLLLFKTCTHAHSLPHILCYRQTISDDCRNV